MPHQITWPVPDHVTMVTIIGGTMADEVQMIADSLYADIEAIPSPHMVHVLINAQGASIPDKVWRYGKLKLRRHTSVHLVIVIGDSRVSGLIIAIFSKFIGLPIHYCENIAAALKIISARDGVVANYLNGVTS